MKLLTEENNKQKADEIRLLLEGNGIPVHMGNADTARNFGFIAYAQKFAVWVIIDEQYQCAEALLRDENHEVKEPVNIEEFYKSSAINKTAVFSFMWKRVIVPGLVVAIVLFALLTFIYAIKS